MNQNLTQLLVCGLVLVGASVESMAAAANAHPSFEWQKSYARMLPQGDLEWTPEPYIYQPGEVIRYIDYAAGDDANSGATPSAAWKHHPWDPNAGATSAAAADDASLDTFVFKGGVG